MGDVALVYKVTLEDQDAIKQVENDIKKIDFGKIEWIKREPFVFGTELIKVAIIIPDKIDGAMEKVEDFLNAIKNVSSINNESMTLI